MIIFGVRLIIKFVSSICISSLFFNSVEVDLKKLSWEDGVAGFFLILLIAIVIVIGNSIIVN